MTKYGHIMVCGKVHKPRPLINLCYSVRRSTEKKYGTVGYIVYFHFEERLFTEKNSVPSVNSRNAPPGGVTVRLVFDLHLRF